MTAQEQVQRTEEQREMARLARVELSAQLRRFGLPLEEFLGVKGVHEG